MSIIPNIKMPRPNLLPINTFIQQEQFLFRASNNVQIIATLTDEGTIKELEPITGKENFEIRDDIKELAIREFQQLLNYSGYESKHSDQDHLEITKGVFNMRLDLAGLLPFSDVTLRQIDMVYQNFVASRNDTYHRAVDIATHNLENAENFTQKDADLFSLAIQSDAATRSENIKTYLAYNPDSNLYKIGRSANPSASLSLIRYIVGSNLQILYVINADLELDLYKRFAIHCHAGEWFTDEGSSMQAYFKAMSQKELS